MLSTKEQLEAITECVRHAAKMVQIRPESRLYTDLVTGFASERDVLAVRLVEEYAEALYGTWSHARPLDSGRASNNKGV